MSYGSSGNGAITHLAIERLKQMTGIDLVHVPYKGTVPAVASVLSGDTVLAFGTIPGVVPHAKAGKLVMLGASFGKRFSQIPEVPAIAETLPGFDMGFYTALLAPAKTPKEIIDKLAAEVAKAHAQPKTREIFAASAAEPGSMTPAQLKAYLASESEDLGRSGARRRTEGRLNGRPECGDGALNSRLTRSFRTLRSSVPESRSDKALPPVEAQRRSLTPQKQKKCRGEGKALSLRFAAALAGLSGIRGRTFCGVRKRPRCGSTPRRASGRRRG